MSGLRISGLTKTFGTHRVLDDISLDVKAGSILAALGPSGGGKTTLLRIIAGFLDADDGSVAFGGLEMVTGGRGIAPQRRHIGYVPQEGALFPHLDVEANVMFGIRRRARRGAEVSDLLALVDLPPSLGRRYPHELSGGQQQRVAVARALAPQPSLVLLDEPFASLDAGLRVETGRVVVQAIRATGATAVLVTHDQGEALALADEVAVLREGRIGQIASPSGLYGSPADPDIASFVGTSVIIPGISKGSVVSTAVGDLHVGQGNTQGTCLVMLRPEHVVLTPAEPAGAAGQVVSVDFFGHDAMVHVQLYDADLHIVARVAGATIPDVGAHVSATVTGSVITFAPSTLPQT